MPKGFYTEKRERRDAARHQIVGSRCLSWVKEYVGLHTIRITRGVPGPDVDYDGLTRKMIEKMQRQEWGGLWGITKPANRHNKIP